MIDCFIEIWIWFEPANETSIMLKAEPNQSINILSFISIRIIDNEYWNIKFTLYALQAQFWWFPTQNNSKSIRYYLKVPRIIEEKPKVVLPHPPTASKQSSWHYWKYLSRLVAVSVPRTPGGSISFSLWYQIEFHSAWFWSLKT